MTLHFELPRPLILNANQRQHWAKKAAVTRDLRALARLQARHLPPMTRAHLVVHVGWADKRKRDVSNIEPTLKALVDGIVDAGVLEDDDDAHLVGPDLRPFVAGKHGLLVLDFDLRPLKAGEVA